MKLKPLALAIGVVGAPLIASASTVTVTALGVTTEALEMTGGAQAPAATLELGAQYAAGDLITLTYSSPPKAAATGTTAFSFPATIAIDMGTRFDNTAAGTTRTDATATNGAAALFDSGDNFVSYRVTTAPSGGIDATTGTQPDFGSISLSRPVFQAAGFGTSDVTVTASSATSQGVAFDAGTATTLVDQAGGQFSYTIAGLSQVIDVESDRELFLSGANTVSTVAITITADTDGGTSAPTLLATDGTIAATLTGDFSWLDVSTVTGIQAIGTSARITSGTATISSVSATSMALVLPAGNTAQVLTLSNNAGVAIPTQSITASLAKTYSNGGTVTGTSSFSGTGAYTLNGSTVTVYAVPTSSSVSNFIWMSNTGAVDGDVSIVVNDGGTATDLGVVATSEAGAELDITAALNAALEAQGVTLSGGRVHLDIVTTVPSADIAVSAAYRVGDDRVNLLTSLETDHD
jgi:hypothetical protein